MVLAGTGQGKFVNALAPNALVHEGPLLVLDPKGEIAAVTKTHRSKLGPVVTIDPFGVLGEPTTDAFNPLDLLQIPEMEIEDLAEALAWELSTGHESSRDPFWQNTASSLIAGLIASTGLDPDPTRRHLGTVIEMMTSEDTVYELAKCMDAGSVYGDFAKGRVREFLEYPDASGSATRSCILASARQYLHCLEAARVRRCLSHSSLDVGELLAGDRPFTAYFVFPPARSKSHRGLMRLWLTSSLQAVMARPAAPPLETLFMIDEAANLGKIDQLPLMLSYLRSSGVSVMHAWQSLGQIMDLYPAEHRTIVENSGSIQVFGLHSAAVRPTATALGIPASTLEGLGPGEQVVLRWGKGPVVCQRIDYRNEPTLNAIADSNPRYAHRGTRR